MTTETILYFAIGVFLLMMIGIVLTMFEFHRLDHPEKTDTKAGPRERKVV